VRALTKEPLSSALHCAKISEYEFPLVNKMRAGKRKGEKCVAIDPEILRDSLLRFPRRLSLMNQMGP